MTAGLECLYKQVNDWDTWQVPGGGQWYNRCTDPSENGFLVQLDKVLGELNRVVSIKMKYCESCKKIVQHTRKMSEDAEELRKLTSDPNMENVVRTIEALVLQQHPEWAACYRLYDFITNQKCYLDQLTGSFHMLSIPEEETKLLEARKNFYTKLRNVLSWFVDVTRAVHIVNAIDGKMKKIAFWEFSNAVSILNEQLVGWADVSNVADIFIVPDDAREQMQKLFGYDIEKSALTNEVIDLVGHIIRKAKNYQKLVKDCKRAAKKDPNFKYCNLRIHDGSKESEKEAK